MKTRRGRILIAGAAALAVVALASPDHRAGIAIHAHQQGDRSPERLQAVVDLGIVGFSFLLTWSKRLRG